MQKNNFDFLRFVFAFLVVLAHTYELSGNIGALHALSIIDTFIPVSGFFIISGFLITRSYSASKTLGQYFIKRIKRLMPGYLFIIIGSALGLSLISTLGLSGYFHSASLYKYLSANLVFLNFLHPCLPGVFDKNTMCAINGSLWTIKVEVSFYIIIPLLFYFINKSNRKLILLSVLYILAVLYNYGLYEFFQKWTGHHGLYFTLSHQLPSLMVYFIAGMAIHFYFDIIMKYKNLLVLIALPVFILEYVLNVEILKPLALSIIIFYVAYSFKAFNNFGKFGDFSYGIYIFHFPLIQLFIYYGMFNKYDPWMVTVIIALTTCILAVLSWHLLEKQFLKRRTVKTKFDAGV